MKANIQQRISRSIRCVLISLVLICLAGSTSNPASGLPKEVEESMRRASEKASKLGERMAEDMRLIQMGIDPAEYRKKKRRLERLRRMASTFAKVQRLIQAGKTSEALKILNNLAMNGNTMAMDMLGTMYLTGQGVKKDHKKAMSYFTSSAKRGGGTGCYMLGMVSFFGKDVTKDYKLAYTWFERAGDYGPALYMRALMHEKELGVSKDPRKMFDLYQKASHLKYFKARACVGECYLLGTGTSENEPMAHKMFSEAAAKNIPKAQFYLAEMYARGQVVDKDLEKAKELLGRGDKSLERILNVEKKDPLAYRGDTDDLVALAKRVRSVIEAGGTGQEIASSEKKSQTAKNTDSTDDHSKVAINKPPAAQSETGSSKRPAESSSNTGYKAPDRNLEKLSNDVEEILKAYYPKVKISKESKSIHFEYKTKQLKESSGLIQVPKLNGIVCDITVKPGRYPNDFMLPRQTHETLYSSLLFAPYSSSADEHLLVKVLFPPNAASDFLNQLKSKLKSTN